MTAQTRTATGGGRWWSSRATRREFRWALVFLAPWIVGFLVFTAGPMLWSLLLSFTDYDPFVGNPDFVGIANYERLFDDSNARRALHNTLFFTLLNVPGTVIIGLFLALMLNRVGRLAGLFRTIFYLPNVTPAVAVGALFLLVLQGSGLLNQALRGVGIANPPYWLTDPDWVMPGIVIMALWTTGATVIILFAALRNVPLEMYEAARIDGASAWQQFRSITVPFISGPLFFVVVVNVIASFQMFAEVWAMFQGRPSAGPSAQRASLLYVPYLFQKAFGDFQFGYASALAWVLFVIILGVTLAQLWLSKRWVYYEGG
ncbi:MAG TPA: sugar ABC transporter permease [Candidatus Caenarcaniphilales bacterium]|nr:sugar ABC transporter permease [Candidatus Caenarcaniphilales bacterium]